MVDDPKEPTGDADAGSSEDSGIVRAVLSGGAQDASAELPLGDLVRGTTVGSYVILGQLSGGDDDSVYTAFDARIDRKVALKVVEVAGADEEEARARREAMIAAAMRVGNLEHPAIVAVRDAGTVGKAVYVAMEFIDGIDLRTWMEARDEPFPWPEVLRVFREAGAGLAAAHAAGCVHGDFTPSRVFMEKSGRICVFDFGLATPVAEVSSPRLTVESLSEELGVQVTDSGDADDEEPRHALVGTPRYLAPELHAGIDPDAKADQFAFCAAMYEALYGEVPFKGETPATIANEALNHAVRPAPAESDVPQWLRDALVKGLSPRRKDRHGSMEVLLRRLEHDPRGRRRRWAVGLGVLAVVGASAGGLALALQREASRCEADAALLAGAWDATTRANLEAAFLSTGRPHAADTWELVEASMDDWAGQWLEHHALACTVRQADDDDVLLARRNACLQGVLQPFAAFSSDMVEEGPSAQMLLGAQRVVSGLWPPSACRSEDVLDYAVPAASANKAALDKAWLLLLAHDFDAARALAEETTQRVPAGEATPMSVRAKLISGLAAARADAPDAAKLLHEAAAAAAAASLRVPQAEAWIALARYDTPPNRATALGHAQILVDAIKVDRLRAELLVARGAHQRAVGHDRDALASYHRALALLQDDDARTSILRSDILLDLAELANSRDEWATAAKYLPEVVAIREATFGPAHPELIGPLQAMGRAEAGAGKTEGAGRAFDRALAIAKQSTPTPSTLADIHIARGALEASQGQHAIAARHYEDAVDVLEGTRSDATLAEALEGLGTAYLASGSPDQATAPLERAVVLAARAGWAPARRSELHDALGQSLVDTDPRGALEAFRRALEGAAATDVARLETQIAALASPADQAD